MSHPVDDLDSIVIERVVARGNHQTAVEII